MSFKRILGHEAAIRLFQGQIAAGRVAHGYLLTGPEGIGKAALALEFARALECEKTSTGYKVPGTRVLDDACGECEPCRKIGEGVYPDLLRVSAESGPLKIDQVRALENFMSLTPYSGRWKVGILDGADELTEEATHACLKILEEPPDRSVFMLIAAVPYRLPATVLSRCHRVRCGPQGIERVATHLQKELNLSAAAARMAAVSSGGRLGWALQLSQGDRIAKRNAFLDQLLAAGRRGELEISIQKMARDEVADQLEWVAGWWRDLLVLRLDGSPDWVMHQDRLEELKKSAGSFTPDVLLDRLERVYTVQEAVRRNASIKNSLALLLSQNG